MISDLNWYSFRSRKVNHIRPPGKELGATRWSRGWIQRRGDGLLLRLGLGHSIGKDYPWKSSNPNLLLRLGHPIGKDYPWKSSNPNLLLRLGHPTGKDYPISNRKRRTLAKLATAGGNLLQCIGESYFNPFEEVIVGWIYEPHGHFGKWT